MKAAIVLSVSLLVFPCLIATAGHDTLPKNLFQIESNVHLGKLIKNYPVFPKNYLSCTTELNFCFQTRGRKSWHQQYRYPKLGVSAVHTSFGNKEVLGYSLGLLPNFTLIKTFGATDLEMRLGAGLAWFNKPFDANTNPENIVIGSRITNISYFSLAFLYRLSTKISLRAGISTWHYSNGHFKVPNLGANLITGTGSLAYQLTFDNPDHFKHPNSYIDKRLRPGFRIGLGIHETEGTTEPYGGPSYPVYGGAVFVSKRMHTISNLSAGINFNYYTSWHNYIINQDIFSGNYRRNASNLVLFAAHEFMIGRLSLNTEAGINVFAPFQQRLKEMGLVKRNFLSLYSTNKIGFRYYFGNTDYRLSHLPFVTLNVKTISGKADFVETGVGYVF